MRWFSRGEETRRCYWRPRRLTYLQAIAIGIAQGITELFSISSLGHCVLPELLGWDTLFTCAAVGIET